MHSSFYDRDRLGLSEVAVAYLQPIFGERHRANDLEEDRRTLFHTGNLTQPYHSVNVDINKRIRFLD